MTLAVIAWQLAIAFVCAAFTVFSIIAENTLGAALWAFSTTIWAINAYIAATSKERP